VLPGVTVEASSPALIEKVRTVVSDGEGRYNIIDLRPGTYSVTFTLPGFRTFRRDGIELTAGFTATVGADMSVGAVEEAITVTGAAPLVDTSNTRKQTVVSSDLLNVLPSSVKNLNSLVTLTPGFRGNEGFDITGGYTGSVGGTYHGKTGTNVGFDGMQIAHATGGQGYNQNQETVQETVLSTSGIGADTNADGVTINMVPKEGGNTFSGSLNGLFSGSGLQSDNLDDELRARGLATVTSVDYIFDSGGTLGGPIKKDRLWFFTSLRWWGNQRIAAGKFINQAQGTPFYVPDETKPAWVHEWYESKAVRITWRASERHKFNFFVDPQRDCHCPANVASGSINAPEAFFSYKLHPAGLYQATWSAPMTNRLLLEAGTARVDGSWPTYSEPVFNVQPTDVSTLEQSTGVRYRSVQTYNAVKHVPRWSQRGSISYVTGSHAFKAGVQLEELMQRISTEVNRDMNWRFNNQIPNQITQWATPYMTENWVNDWGFYAQDQWTIKRLTLNYGIRYDYFDGHIPVQHVDATANGWVPARDFERVEDVPLWKDWNPRFGGAYDLFGNGRTAVKAAIGRYVARNSTNITIALNPLTTSVNSVNRTWNDSFYGAGDPRSGNYEPDCNLADLRANGECLDADNFNLGAFNPNTRYTDDAIRGYDARGFNWDMTTEVQHEINANLSVNAGYYRNWYGNFLATDNTLWAPGDFSSYCVTAPLNPELPNGGGYQVCGLYDIAPSLFSATTANEVTQADRFGKLERLNEFFNVSFNARIGPDIRFGGGVDSGRTVNDACFNVDSPGAVANSLPGVAATPTPFTATTIDGQKICRVVTPFSAQTQVKGFASYPFPGDLVVSAVYQNVSGPQVTAEYTATNDEIRGSLGRNLAACGTRVVCTSTVTVPLIVPQTKFEDRYSRLDLRVAKRFRLPRNQTLQANFNVYNIFNSNAIQVLNTTYGSRWRQPSLIEDGRMIQFSGTFSF
jgi:hypothetical protein